MGKTQSRDLVVHENEHRPAFIALKMVRTEGSGMFGTYAVFTFAVRYRRFFWEIDLRYSDLLQLEKKLMKNHSDILFSIPKLPHHSKFFWQQDKLFLMERAKVMTKYLQDVLDIQIMIETSSPLLQALGASMVSFAPELGRKGKEGWLKKSSGGYKEKFSRKTGDYFQVWRWRWFVLQENCIMWFKSPNDTVPAGTLQIDQEFEVTMTKRVLRVSTGTRNLVLYASTLRGALDWARDIKEFYGTSVRVERRPFESSFPPRPNCDVRAYTVTKDYMHAVALAMLGAQRELLIADWKMSPHVILTRPPLPPLRLDQILKYKADQGVQIRVLLYKEVEHIGQGNDSGKVKSKLESLSSNIRCIRHPNKFFGGSTAMLWSHHEKFVVVDRNVVFVGGVDLAFQRWDDERHLLYDEDGVCFPGHDYRQPAPGKHKAARTEAEASEIKAMEEEEFIEVELAVADENLPQATITTPDYDDEPYEVEVVVDFSLPESQLPAPPRVMQQVQPQSQQPDSLAAATTDDGPAPPCEEDFPENMSEFSVNYAEDRDVAMTMEERAAAALQQINSTITNRRSSLMESISNAKESVTSGISTAKESVNTTISFFKESATSYLSNVVNSQCASKQVKSLQALESRELYPRMGWHDIQCAISGRVARDVAAHFIQRWNHHRLSTSSLQEPVMTDITDDVFFSVCARCSKTGIHEAAALCPACGYDLGPPLSFSLPPSVAYVPPDPARFSSMVFECHYDVSVKLPFRMEGDCPVVVTMLLPSVMLGDNGQHEKDGIMIDVAGPMAEWLHAAGLRPMIGDVVLSIDGQVVTQLNSTQLRRLLAKKRRRAKLDPSLSDVMVVTFRRHYLEDLHETLTKVSSQGYAPAGEVDHPLAMKLGMAACAPPLPAPTHDDDPARRKIAEHDSHTAQAAPVTAPSPVRATMAVVESSTAVPVAAAAQPGDTFADGAHVTAEVQAVAPPQQKIDQFHPACLAAAQKEVQLSISRLFHEHAQGVERVPRIIEDTGTCVVQALRSTGKWSIGTKTEKSILNCYIETIQNAQHFIYIENQFFVGSLAGEGVQNGIPLALAERILRAHAAGQPFKVIVIIPMHPNGDFCNAMKAKVVMHYEYLTINRGVGSLFRLLRNRAPAINISDYIGFFSLRNWGVINNKVVSEQVYIHDKLMIVDDRVAIIGSANINDRSMLGSRDSEIAVRVEDTLHITSSFNGTPYTVGYFPFMLRTKLMKQHCADESLDFADPLKPEVFARWQAISQNNSTVYDELDGAMSLYRCLTVAQYKNALETRVHRSILDPQVQASVAEIKGFVVDWPQGLFRNEDLGPSLATRALIPDELWV